MYPQKIEVEQERVPKGSVNLSHKSTTGDYDPHTRAEVGQLLSGQSPLKHRKC
jgi:hypothetical protein